MQNTQGQWDSKCSLFSTSRCKKNNCKRSQVVAPGGVHWPALRRRLSQFHSRRRRWSCPELQFSAGCFKKQFSTGCCFLKIQISLVQVELQTFQDKIPVTHFPPFACINANKFRTNKDTNFQKSPLISTKTKYVEIRSECSR